ncbi:hypothetical protein KSP40_PGU022575 [Platanthera guangdongensis]|uniref:Uncharacterized protein n=1 Tax=Platanthera guangdongensis TaxID=2320717 RepID=A0ABR2M6N0_9ASPA
MQRGELTGVVILSLSSSGDPPRVKPSPPSQSPTTPTTSRRLHRRRPHRLPQTLYRRQSDDLSFI